MKNVQDIYRLSPMQREMLFYSLYAPTEGANVEQVYWTWRGPLDLAALQRAWQRVVERHPILRTAFFWEGVPEPAQAVRQTVTVRIEQLDWQGLPVGEQDARLAQYLEVVRREGIHLSQAPLMRLGVMQVGPEVYRCTWSYHHVLLDGWSAPVCLREVLLLYQAFCRGQESELETPRPYREYIQWLGRQNLAEARRYWQETLAGFDTATPLFLGEPAPSAPGQERRYLRRELQLSATTTAELQARVRQHRLTLNTLVQGAWAVLLSRYSGEDDVVFGATVSGRPPALPGVDTMVGLFINTLPVRARVSPEAEVGAFLQALQAEQFAARRYDYLPLLEIRSLGEAGVRQRLFDSVLVVENLPERHLAQRLETGAEMCDVGRTEARTGFPLTFMVLPGTELMIQCIFDEARFHAAAVERMLAAFGQLLEGLLADPARKLREVSVLTEEERRVLLRLGNATAGEGARGPAACIHERIAAQAAKTPDALAVVQGSRQLTYGTLDARATRLGQRLRSLGVGLGARVGLCLDRSPDVLVAMLGTLKAGGAYVPLDPASPKERLASMLEQAEVRVLLTEAGLVPSLPEVSIPVVVLDGPWEADTPETALEAVPPEAAAYVIYTSGSTGAPKGVVIEHHALTRIATALAGQFALTPSDRVLQFTSLVWDTCGEEIYPCLLSGACLVLRTEAMLDPHALLKACGDLGVTVADWPTAYWHEVVEILESERLSLPPELRLLIIGGEAASPEKLGRWFTRVGARPRLLNTFGPTETTIVATCAELTGAPAPGRPVPIGRPLPGVETYVLDRAGQLAPLGVPGELFIGGVGVARGYLNDPRATAERFLLQGLGNGAGARWYRTGDLVRYRHDGALEFLGRCDRQVKIRGIRIEPGEIERRLAQHPGVKDVVVLVREDEPGQKHLVAYVVLRGESVLVPGELRAFLAERLPEAMVPASFVVLEALPRTSRDKLDLAAFPAPQAQGRDERSQVPPRGPLEEQLARVFGDVLKLERLGVHDSFFELGGNSLMAMQVVSRVRRDLGVELPLRALFASPTVAATAAEVERARADKALPTPPLGPAPRAERLPLSFAQQRLWFLEQLVPGSPLYNIVVGLRIQGPIDVAAFERSLQAVGLRHETLRTTFAASDGQPYQRIAPEMTLPCRVLDLQGEPEAEVRRLAMEEAQRPFDLGTGPLLRTLLLGIGAEEHVLVLSMHHIVSDGWSMGVLVRELAALYEACSQGRTSELPPLPVQYVDYAVWQREWLGGERLERQLGYWKRQLAGVAPLELPTDMPRPRLQSHRGAVVPVAYPRALQDRLVRLAQKEGATLFMVLLGAFQLLLSRYARQSDVAVGTPIAGRTRTEVEGLVGFFVNTLVLRTDLSGSLSFKQLLGRVKEVTLEGYAHQDVPFEKVVEVLAPERQLDRTPLFQVVFVLQNAPVPEIRREELRLSPLAVDSGTAKFDLTLSLAETAEGLRGMLEYNTDLFAAETMARMAGHLETLLTAIVAAPERAIHDLPLLTEAERRTLLVEWAGRGTERAYEACVHELFEAQAARTPDALAVASDARSLTYGELDARANQLARVLRQRGVGPETPVAIFLERSPEMVLAILAVLKAGGAYVPLDPVYPAERLAYVLGDTQTRVLLTVERLAANLPAGPWQIMRLDTDWGAVAQGSPERLPPCATPAHLAYVIYTSGSTGRPKGTAITHRALLHLVSWHGRAFDVSVKDKAALIAGPAFDASVWETWPYLVAGASLHVPDEEKRALPESLRDWLVGHGITLCFVPTPLAEQLVLLSWPAHTALRRMLTGGDRLHQSPPSGLPFELINNYGPTETTVVATSGLVPPEAESVRAPDLGRPLDHVEVYVLDPRLQPVPVGVLGEVYLGGAGLGRGYWRQPGLTAERFVPHPFASSPGGARLYRTGDLGRWLPGGRLEFLGRTDFQVKVRGFRIELGEIEQVLGRHPQVREALVMAREDVPGDKRLVAYVVPRGEGELASGALREHLRQQLPEYMVPAALVSLAALPLSPNGKVDRKALPVPQVEAGERGGIEEPRTEMEVQLAQLFAEVLHQPRVGIRDDFFALGGHSLLATQLVARIKKTLQVELPLRALFDAWDPLESTCRHASLSIL